MQMLWRKTRDSQHQCYHRVMHLKSLSDYTRLAGALMVETGVRYALFAGLAWLLVYVWLRRKVIHRKVIARWPASGDVWREIRWSLCTLVIYGIVGAATIFAMKQGWTQAYWKFGKHGWPWFVASIALTIILHDTWFYWTHRAMHHPKLFRAFHRVHHLSTNPSPWAAYSFSPLEAVAQAAIFPLAMFLIPMHPFAFALFMLWQITFNVAGHTGIEYHPRWLMDTWLGKFLNTPTNHVMHHEFFRGNYGLYFNCWDRLMGTNHERYEARFREVTSRSKDESL